ncbi:MAG: SRPBCC family protein [Myxococcales bacterium]
MSVRPRVQRVSGSRAWVPFSLLIGIAIWLAASLGLGDSGATGAQKGFSPQEEQLLRAGKLVARAKTEDRGSLRLIGGTSWQLIDAPPDAVFRALLDTSRYYRMMPAVTGSTLVAEQPGYRKVRLEHKKGPVALSYNLGTHVYPERRDITFSLEEAPAGLPRAAWGFFSVRPFGAKQTLLAYGAMADPGDGLVLTLVRSTVQEWMLQVPRQVKWYVESREGRARYGAK